MPAKHRTDHLGAATFGGLEREEFGTHCMALMRHYDMRPTKNNAAESHENGDVEQAHYRIKDQINQALLLRGSRDFARRSDYETFVRDLFESRNRNRRKRLQEERAALKPLPAFRLDDFREYSVPVSSRSTVCVAHNTYSVPSRLIRHEVKARLYADRVEIHLAGQCVYTMDRLRGTGKSRIEYRHVIGTLVRKPGAFANHRYREEMFPSIVFRRAYDWLLEQVPSHAGARYLRILEWATRNSESGMEGALHKVLDAGEELCFERVVSIAERPLQPAPEVAVPAPDLSIYDRLLEEVCA